jgi:Integrase core domain
VLTFFDDFSKRVFVYFLKSKSEVTEKCVELKNMVENQTGSKIKILRSDNGSEYVNKEMAKFLKSNGIIHQTTNVYTPQQNGVAERMNRTLVEKAKCFLIDLGLKKSFWAEALNTAAYIINSSNVNNENKTLNEVFFDKKPDLSDLKLFGSKVMVLISKPKRRKWDKNSQEKFFVGYDETTKGYHCVDGKTGLITLSRDVFFLESTEDNTLSFTSDKSEDQDNSLTTKREPKEEPAVADLDLESTSRQSTMDYEQTFSPVVRHTPIRTLIAMAVKNNLNLHQME